MNEYKIKRDILNISSANGFYWFAVFINIGMLVINLVSGNSDIVSIIAMVFFIAVLILSFWLFKKEKVVGLYIVVALYIVDTLFFIPAIFSGNPAVYGLIMRAFLLYGFIIAIRSMKDMPKEVDIFGTIKHVKEDRKIRRKEKQPYMTKMNKLTKEKPVFLTDIIYRDEIIPNNQTHVEQDAL